MRGLQSFMAALEEDTKAAKVEVEHGTKLPAPWDECPAAPVPRLSL